MPCRHRYFHIWSPISSWFVKCGNQSALVPIIFLRWIGPCRGDWRHMRLEACRDCRSFLDLGLASKYVLQISIEIDPPYKLLLSARQSHHSVRQTITTRAVRSWWVNIEQISRKAMIFRVCSRVLQSWLRVITLWAHQSKCLLHRHRGLFC